MWPLLLLSVSLLQLGREVQCCAQAIGDTVHVLPEHSSASWRLGSIAESQAEALHGVLSHSGRRLKQGPPLASSESITTTLAQACPDVDTEAATFLCSTPETTLSSGQSVRPLFHSWASSHWNTPRQCVWNVHRTARFDPSSHRPSLPSISHPECLQAIPASHVFASPVPSTTMALRSVRTRVNRCKQSGTPTPSAQF